MTRGPAKDLGLCALKLARGAPELVPAFTWLVTTGGRSLHVKAFRQARPTAEELAGVTVFLGEPVREILSHNKIVLRLLEGVDVGEHGEHSLLAVRLIALKRLGLGVEFLF